MHGDDRLGGGTFDINGNDVTLAYAIGGSGGRSTVASTAGGGMLTLGGRRTRSPPSPLTAVFGNFNSLGNLGNSIAIAVNGGTLQWASGAGNLDITSGGYSTSLGNNGGTFDINGNNVTLAGAIGGSGGLTFVSSSAPATSTLQANGYTGPTRNQLRNVAADRLAGQPEHGNGRRAFRHRHRDDNHAVIAQRYACVGRWRHNRRIGRGVWLRARSRRAFGPQRLHRLVGNHALRRRQPDAGQRRSARFQLRHSHQRRSD